MYTIRIEKECGCFKKSNLENNLTFENKEDALMKARVLECRMNQEFCMKHYFDAVDMGDEIVIKSMIRPVDDDDDDTDVRELIAKNMVHVNFSGEESPS